jgi:hypothetical protein
VPQLTHVSVGWGWLGGSIAVLLQSSSCLTSFTAGELLLLLHVQVCGLLW